MVADDRIVFSSSFFPTEVKLSLNQPACDHRVNLVAVIEDKQRRAAGR